MATISKELLWRLRSAEFASSRQFLDVWASVEGNPMKAWHREHSWGNTMHFSGSPNNSVFNRAAAYGEGMPAHLDDIEAEFVALGVTPFIELSAVEMIDDLPGSPLHNLHDCGYRVHDIEGIYYGETDKEFAAPSKDVEIRQVSSSRDAAEFLEINAMGWNMPEPNAGLWKGAGHRLFDDPAFTAWIAYLNGVPAGCAQLYIHQGVGYFADACVLKAHRHRGCQRALFSARLDKAREEGADIVFSIAEVASQSARNMENFGLRLATELWHWRKKAQ